MMIGLKTKKIRHTESRVIDPVHADQKPKRASAVDRLVLFLRIMAAIALVKGLYHWARICGFNVGIDGGFESQSGAWQTATVFFAVIDLVAAVGLWLAAAWGAVVWLTAVVSMAAVDLLFPAVFGGSIFVVGGAIAVIAAYLLLAFFAAREQP
jgi:hypothetical protein